MQKKRLSNENFVRKLKNEKKYQRTSINIYTFAITHRGFIFLSVRKYTHFARAKASSRTTNENNRHVIIVFSNLKKTLKWKEMNMPSAQQK